MNKKPSEFDLRYCGKCHAMTNHVRLSDDKKAVEAAARKIFAHDYEGDERVDKDNFKRRIATWGDGSPIINSWKDHEKDCTNRAKQILRAAEEAEKEV